MKDIVCNGCSLLCDDGSVNLDNEQIESLGLCRLGHSHIVASLSREHEGSVIRNNGQEKKSTIDDGIEEATRILIASDKVLICGLSEATSESIEEAYKIASVIDADIFSSTELGPHQTMSSDLHSMKLEVDLEFVRNQGEFIIYWGCNPTESLHRHPSRFAVLPSGEKIPEGVESRIIGVVDVRETETMKMANHRFKIPIGKDAELLEILAKEVDGEGAITEPFHGIPEVEILGFVRGFKKADTIIIFYGTGLINSGNFAENLEALGTLIDSLRNSGKQAYALPMFPKSNVMGLLSKMGSKVTNNTMFSDITSNTYDTILVIEDDILSEVPGALAKSLSQSKIVNISGQGGITDLKSDVSIRTPNAVVSGAGVMRRIDLTEFKLVSLKPSSQSVHEILKKLHDSIVKNKK